MSELKTTITIVEIIIGALALVILGDYLGYKVGHRRVANIAGIMAGIVIVVFVIYAAIILARSSS